MQRNVPRSTVVNTTAAKKPLAPRLVAAVVWRLQTFGNGPLRLHDGLQQLRHLLSQNVSMLFLITVTGSDTLRELSL